MKDKEGNILKKGPYIHIKSFKRGITIGLSYGTKSEPCNGVREQRNLSKPEKVRTKKKYLEGLIRNNGKNIYKCIVKPYETVKHICKTIK